MIQTLTIHEGRCTQSTLKLIEDDLYERSPAQLCDRLPEPLCLFMVRQAHNRKEIRLRKKNARRSSLHSRRRSTAFPSVPIKLFRRPPACRFMSEGGRGGGGVRDMCSLAPKRDAETKKQKSTCRCLRSSEDPPPGVLPGKRF